MEESGIIRGYTALVDPAVFGWNMISIATIRLGRQNEDAIVMFEDAIRGWDEVLECHLVTGSRDYVLKVATGGLDQYERFIKENIAGFSIPPLSAPVHGNPTAIGTAISSAPQPLAGRAASRW